MRPNPSHLLDYFTTQIHADEPGFPDGILLFENQVLVYLNKKASDLLKIDLSERNRRPGLMDMLSEAENALLEMMYPSFSDNSFTNIQLHLKGNHSATIWADTFIKRETKSDGDLLFMVFHDISDFISIKENLTLIYQAIQQSADTFVITDLEGNIEFVNAAFSQATGYTSEEAIGKNPRVLKSGKTPRTVFDDLWLTVKQGKKWKGEIVNRKKDGTFYEVELVIAPFFNEDGVLVKFIGCHRDITAKKRMYEELIFLEKLSVAGELAPRIAHEMNNQLLVISGKAQKARFLTQDNDKLGKALDETLREIEEMASQIKNLMELGKPRHYQVEEFRLDEVFSWSLHALETTGILKHITVSWFTDQQPHKIKGDFHSLVQVINNLIINASHAIEKPGHIHLGVRSRNHKVTGFIKDSGRGIPEAIQAKIFDPFFTTKAEGKGTGLGLSISKQIVDAHKGTIRFHSKAGKGTIFFLSFPSVDTGSSNHQERESES